MSKKQFERLLGPLTQLQEEQYITDPRKALADFYEGGDRTGPQGTLELRNMQPVKEETTSWFAVYRPTSSDAIAKMLAGDGVGKGLNVKGKSAKKGLLSGFVPFLQISNNDHKAVLEESPRSSRLSTTCTASAPCVP